MNQDHAPREDVIKALVGFETATTSMKTLLREMHTTSADSYEPRVLTQVLALSVIRYRNTIDFILSRSISKKHLQNLNSRDRNILRLALFEIKWLKTDKSEILSSFPEIKHQFYAELNNAVNFNLDESIKDMPIVNQLSLKYSHPTFLVATLLNNLNRDDTIRILNANNQSRTYYIRSNKLYDDSELVLESLENIDLQKDPDVPEISRVVHGIDTLISSELFKEGRVLIQDKASVLAVNALNPKPGEKIWDACAAPGMKTQLIAERMQGSGEIVATDIYKERVKSAQEWSKKLNAQQIEWLQADATEPVVKDADKILIDAPCSSTGTLQTYPSFKWRLNKETLFALMTVQNKILNAILSAYADRPGTEIVYSTCSLLPHEGESQIDSALQRHNVELVPALDYGSSGYTSFECSNMVQRLFPHRHDSSGFFIARLRVMR
ncbi:MAG: RsmB/NOP family class I SAM-dependent RNA methyltransferase [Candidatus Thorarchaeota archaeon]